LHRPHRPGSSRERRSWPRAGRRCQGIPLARSWSRFPASEPAKSFARSCGATPGDESATLAFDS
jgi:hypothetical protein